MTAKTDDHSLHTLSPLDGRYTINLEDVASKFSEAALIRWRVEVEIRYFKLLSKYKIFRKLSKKELEILDKLLLDTWENNQAIQKVKEIEKTTHHDVKAVEYFIHETLANSTLKDCLSFIHFGLTSEDVNNLAYRSMIKSGIQKVLLPQLKNILRNLLNFSQKNKDVSMLARTHGQPAVPTTLGKEIIVFAWRLMQQIQDLENIALTGKCNGAVGNYQAMVIGNPEVNWKKLSQELVKSFDLKFSGLTTQINQPDDLINIFSKLHHINSILIDLSQDIWRYISDNWLVQKGKESHVGSSTMPQKINPIEFENAEGNLGIANSLLEFFMRKLPVSRLQRDLSDSTVMRNVGSCFGYSKLAYKNLSKGLGQLSANKLEIEKALNENYAILLEAWQTFSRARGDDKAYEKAAGLGKNKILTAKDWQKLTKKSSKRLSNLKPATYIGLAHEITEEYIKKILNYLDK